MKNSGYGRELTELGMREFLNAKTVWVGQAVSPVVLGPAASIGGVRHGGGSPTDTAIASTGRPTPPVAGRGVAPAPGRNAWCDIP